MDAGPPPTFAERSGLRLQRHDYTMTHPGKGSTLTDADEPTP